MAQTCHHPLGAPAMGAAAADCGPQIGAAGWVVRAVVATHPPMTLAPALPLALPL